MHCAKILQTNQARVCLQSRCSMFMCTRYRVKY